MTPLSPPHEQNHPPPITASPPPASVPSSIEYVDHHFTNSVSPSSPPQLPENSPDRQQPPPPEHLQHQQEPPVPPSPPRQHKFDYQQPLEPPPPSPSSLLPPSPSSLLPPSPSSLLPPSPPPTATEEPPEKFSPEYPLSKQPPSPSPSTPPAGPDSHTNPNPTSEHESTLSKQPPSSEPDDPIESPNLRQSPSPNLDHESPSPSSPAKLQVNPNPKPNQSPQDTLTPPLAVPILHVAASSSPNKPQISPWTHQETTNLIQAYQEKWYALKKGPLKAGQWEEVAITVAARCGYDEPTKTSKQCRHKLEKLRKRYRAERGKPRSKATAWDFFKLMDNLEKGPLPISSSQSMALVEYQKPSNSNGKKRKNNHDDNDDDDGDGDFLVNKRSSSRSKNYTHHVPNGYLTRNLRFADGGSRVVRGLRTPVVHKHKGFYKEVEEEEEEEDGDGVSEEGVAAQLAVEIKGFAEKFVKMENKKIEMIRDVERYRLEMENKRMEMILESQQMLVETVNNAFSTSHKLSAN